MNINENNCDMFRPWASWDNSELLLVIAFCAFLKKMSYLSNQGGGLTPPFWDPLLAFLDDRDKIMLPCICHIACQLILSEIKFCQIGEMASTIDEKMSISKPKQ